jgi:uncharacterized membrane protein YqjE
MEKKPGQQTTTDPHLITVVLALAKNMFGLFLNRIELASLELSEVRTTLLKLAVVFAVGLVSAWFAIAYWSALLVYLTWDSLGWKILLIIAAGFTVITVAILLYARAIIAEGKLTMPATMRELRNDRDALL